MLLFFVVFMAVLAFFFSLSVGRLAGHLLLPWTWATFFFLSTQRGESELGGIGNLLTLFTARRFFLLFSIEMRLERECAEVELRDGGGRWWVGGMTAWRWGV